MVATVRWRRYAKARREHGFTYLWVLVAIAVLGVGLLAVSEVWVTSARRQKLVELDWIGGEFTRAIGSYYQATPGTAKSYPTNLHDLIEDRRYVTMRRHLRAIYRNPFSGAQDWETIRSPGGQIVGIRARTFEGNTGVVTREYVYRPTVD